MTMKNYPNQYLPVIERLQITCLQHLIVFESSNIFVDPMSFQIQGQQVLTLIKALFLKLFKSFLCSCAEKRTTLKIDVPCMSGKTAAFRGVSDYGKFLYKMEKCKRMRKSTKERAQKKQHARLLQLLVLGTLLFRQSLVSHHTHRIQSHQVPLHFSQLNIIRHTVFMSNKPLLYKETPNSITVLAVFNLPIPRFVNHNFPYLKFDVLLS